MGDFEDSLDALVNAVPAPEWLDLEPLITDGYARVLSLEAERLRVMRELIGLADSSSTADQAASLTIELDGIASELLSLRASLRAARERFVPEDSASIRPAAG